MTNAYSQELCYDEVMDVLCTQGWSALGAPPQRLHTFHSAWTSAALQQHALPVQSRFCASSVRVYPVLLPLPTGACQPCQLISQQAEHRQASSRCSLWARGLRGHPQHLFWWPARAALWALQPRGACSPACHTSCQRCVPCRMTLTPHSQGPPGLGLDLPLLGLRSSLHCLPECGRDIRQRLQQVSAVVGMARLPWLCSSPAGCVICLKVID